MGVKRELLEEIKALREEVEQLRREIEAKPRQEIHYHYDNKYYPYYPYTVTYQNIPYVQASNVWSSVGKTPGGTVTSTTTSAIGGGTTVMYNATDKCLT